MDYEDNFVNALVASFLIEYSLFLQVTKTTINLA